jgi:hypothetical protein
MRIAIIALLTAVHVLACVSLGPEGRTAWIAGSHLVAKVLAAAGCAAATYSLARRDLARWFWGTLSACYVLLALLEGPVARTIALGSRDGGVLVSAVCLIAANLLSLVGSAVLAWLFRQRASLEVFGAYLLALLVSAAVVQHGLRTELAFAVGGGGGLTAWSSALSYLADGVAFVLLVPVLFHVFQVGGRPEAWPWLAYFASGACWLLFSSMERLHSPGGASALIPSEALRTAATLLAGLAGLYQRDLAPLRRGEAAQRERAVGGL